MMMASDSCAFPQVFYEVHGDEVLFSILPPMSTAEDLLLEIWLPALDALTIDEASEHEDPSVTCERPIDEKQSRRDTLVRMFTNVMKRIRRRYERVKMMMVHRTPEWSFKLGEVSLPLRWPVIPWRSGRMRDI